MFLFVIVLKRLQLRAVLVSTFDANQTQKRINNHFRNTFEKSFTAKNKKVDIFIIQIIMVRHLFIYFCVERKLTKLSLF